MRIIKKMTEQMKEEIASAKEYAKLAIHYKTEQPTLAKVYYDAANDELKHADWFHSEVVKLIEKQRAIEPPPPVMLELWEYEHKEYIEEYGIAKNMIALYSNPR